MLTALDLSADVGLVAVSLATINVALGLLIWARYSPKRLWPHRRFDVFGLHRWTAYGALALILIHPIPLLFVKQPAFRLLDIALPLWSPQQPWVNTVGAAALYLMVIVVVTSIYRAKLGRALWKKLHYLTYAAAAGMLVHGILTDPELKNARIDFLDGEKVLVEACALVLLAAALWRFGTARHWREERQMAAHRALGGRAVSDPREKQERFTQGR